MKKILFVFLFVLFVSGCAPYMAPEVILITPEGASGSTYKTDIPSSLSGGHYELWCSSPDKLPYFSGEDSFGEYRVHILYTPGSEKMEVSLALEGSNLVSARGNINLVTGEFSDLYLLDTDQEAEANLRKYVLGANLADIVFRVNVEAPLVAQSYFCAQKK